MESIRNAKAILKRELASYFNSPVAYVFLFFFLMFAGFFTFMLGGYYEYRQADLGAFFRWHPWLYLVLAPAATMRLWAEERRGGTIELLLTMPIRPIDAILGKFVAAWLFMGLALALTFPIVLTTVYLGSPDPGVVVVSYIGSFMLAGAYLSIGTLTSAMTRNQVIGFILAVFISFFLLLAGWPPITNMLMRLPERWQWLLRMTASLSWMPHFESCQRGVLDLRDMLYYVSVIVFMLFGTHLVLENRKSL